MKTGIYMIVNRVNSKCYVGSTSTGFQKRWREHRHALRKNKHHSNHLQRSWNKYGEEAFALEPIFTCPPEECLAAEQVFLNVLCPVYNVLKLARSSFGHSCGPMSEEGKRIRSEALKGKPKSVEHKIALSESAKRRTPEHLSRLAEAARNRAPVSEATRLKMSESAKRRIRTAS